MAEHNASDHLLFGVLAFQNGCIDENQFLGAVRKWLKNKSVSLEQILVESKALSPKDREMLIPMVQRHVEDHGGDASVCIATTDAFADVWKPLEHLEDEDIDEALQKVSECIASQESEPDADPLITVPTPDFATTFDIASRFRFLRTYTAGGMGTISVAADTQIADREVAFKEIRDKYADDPLSRQRFRVEAEITGGLEHPNIVPVYGLGADKTGRPFYAMRFIHGDSLKDAIRDYYKDRDSVTWVREDEGETTSRSQRNRYRFRRLLEKFIDVCQAIHYAHCRGVLHRDLKPGNVMLGRYNEVLVVDWGLAISQPRGEELKDETDEPTLVAPSADDKTGPKKGLPEGTPAYMAPEQAAGRIDLFGKQTDVYALGATLYCILTGMPPFATDSELKTTLSKVEAGDFAQPTAVGKDVPKPLEAICLRAMATRPRDRYASADELANDVQHWLDDEAVSAWKEPITAKAFRWMRHHQKTVTGLGAAIAVGLLASVVLLRFVDQARRNEVALKDEAIRNYQVARKAVDQFYTEVSEEGLLSQPGVEKKRDQLLNQAKSAYFDFADNYGSEANEELARTLFRLGVITEQLKSDQEAIEFHKQALSEQIRLLANGQPPGDAAVAENESVDKLIARAATRSNEPSFSSVNLTQRFDLANTLNAIGRVLNRKNDRTNARAAFETALTIRKGIADEESDARNKRKYANTLMNLGRIDYRDGDEDIALSRFQESNEIREDPSCNDFNDYEWNRDKAKGLVQEAYLLVDKSEAIRKIEDAIEIIDSLLETPANTELELDKSDFTQYLLWAIKGAGNREREEEVLTERVKRAKALRDASRDVREHTASLARLLIELGDFYYRGIALDNQTADWSSARRQHEKAIELLNGLDAAKSLDDRRDRAYAQKVLAKIDDREDKIDSALERIHQSVATFSELVKADDANQKYRIQLNDARTFQHKIEGRQFLRDGEFENAVQSLNAAIEGYERIKGEGRLQQLQFEHCKQLREQALAGAN